MAKNTTKKPLRKKTSSQLTLHELIIALSFWGTAVRTMLFGFLAGAVFLVALTEAVNVSAADSEVMILIYVLGSFLLLDFGYVLVARTYRLRRLLDVPVLALADSLLALLYIVPKVVVDSAVTVRTDPLLFVIFIPLVVLALRMLVGMLYGTRQR